MCVAVCCVSPVYAENALTFCLSRFGAATMDGAQKSKGHDDVRNRINLVQSHFRSRYHREPNFYIGVPGRVNLIGEHVDYCGYSVCPMTIEQNVLVAVCAAWEGEDNGLSLTNLDDKYQDYEHKNLREIRELELDGHQNAPAWYNYFLCGVKGALEVISEEHIPRSIYAAVSGNIPANAGLSSSSALVSAALYATLKLCKITMSKEAMATLSAKAERYIGTQGGGMDQAIAFLGMSGSAQLIEFNPLRSFKVVLPNNAVFVIVHSLVYHNKAATTNFNARVLECRLAAQVIASKNGITDWQTIQKLIDVHERLGLSLEDMATMAMTNLHVEPYTHEEICQILGTTAEQLKSISNVPHNATEKFKLRQRALHVFQEAGRVAEFRKVCEDRNMTRTDQLRRLGELMSESHSSLRDLYECSHPRLDALVETAIECGALGARLTGAGWGGCVVAITTDREVEEFLDGIKNKFYKNNEKTKNLDLSNFVFKTQPTDGATVYCQISGALISF